jgi:hypothetical protein
VTRSLRSGPGAHCHTCSSTTHIRIAGRCVFWRIAGEPCVTVMCTPRLAPLAQCADGLVHQSVVLLAALAPLRQPSIERVFPHRVCLAAHILQPGSAARYRACTGADFTTLQANPETAAVARAVTWKAPLCPVVLPASCRAVQVDVMQFYQRDGKDLAGRNPCCCHVHCRLACASRHEYQRAYSIRQTRYPSTRKAAFAKLADIAS